MCNGYHSLCKNVSCPSLASLWICYHYTKQFNDWSISTKCCSITISSLNEHYIPCYIYCHYHSTSVVIIPFFFSHLYTYQLSELRSCRYKFYLYKECKQAICFQTNSAELANFFLCFLK